MLFFITEPIFGVENKLSSVYNMASSGLKKMLLYIILRYLKGVWENVMTYNILMFCFYKIIFKADVMPFIIVDVISGRCYSHEISGRC